MLAKQAVTGFPFVTEKALCGKPAFGYNKEELPTEARISRTQAAILILNAGDGSDRRLVWK